MNELHQNFINDNSFINIGQVITKTLEGIAINESSSVQQKLNYHQTKSSAKNIVGSVLYDALSKLAIRVTCGATNSDKHKYPITHLHIRCLCCNQTICIKTLDLLDQCNTIDDANKSDASDTEDVLLFNKLTDLIIIDFIKRHIFKSLQCISRNKRTPYVTVKGNVESLDIESDDKDKILQRYDSHRFF